MQETTVNKETMNLKMRKGRYIRELESRREYEEVRNYIITL